MKKIFNLILVALLFCGLANVKVDAKGYGASVANSQNACNSLAQDSDVACYTDLQTAVDDIDGGSITLLTDMTIDSPITINKTVGIDFHGNKIITSDSFVGSSAIIINNNAFIDLNTQTYVDGGKQGGIEASNVSYAVYVDGGTLNANSGIYNAKETVIYVNNGEARLSGGTYTNEDGNDLLVVVDTNTGHISASGGKFYKYDFSNMNNGITVPDNYAIGKENDYYTVGKHTIKVTANGNGTLYLPNDFVVNANETKEYDVYGDEKIPVKFKADPGYYALYVMSPYYTLKTTGEHSTALSASEEIKFDFEKIEEELIPIADTDTDENTKALEPTMDLNTTVMNTTISPSTFFDTGERDQIIQENAKGIIYLSVKSDDASIDVKTDDNGKKVIDLVLDIKLVKDFNGKLTYVSEVKDDQGNPALVTIKFKLPDSIVQSSTGKTRKYTIIRYHDNDGVIEKTELDAFYNEYEETLTFETDRFSTYAIAHEDEVTEDTKTNTNTNTSSTRTPTCEELGKVWSESRKQCVYKVSNTSVH